MASKQLEQGDKDIVNLGAEATKLAKKAYPEQEEMPNRQAVEVFFLALDPKLPLEVLLAEAWSSCVGRCHCLGAAHREPTERLPLSQHGKFGVCIAGRAAHGSYRTKGFCNCYG